MIDEAESRHGVPAANVRWDNTVAILTGDYLFARASEVGADLGPDVCRILAQTIAVLCDGQIREVDASRRLDRAESTYLEVIRRKTGSLIAASCRLGGMMSDASAEHVEILDAFGESLGLAFQLSDDIMDLTVQPARARQGAGRGPEGGRLHAPGPPRPRARPPIGRSWRGSSPRASTASSSTARSRSSRTATHIEHARKAVRDEVERAVALVERLPEGPAQHALVQLARFLSARCGADGIGGKSP